jgi:hypothetical protein
MTTPIESDNVLLVPAFEDVDDDDSLFGLPSLASRCYSSSDESVDGLNISLSSSSSSSFQSATASLSLSLSTSSGSSGFESLGPPPPGSIMSFWDRPMPTSFLHDIPHRTEDSKCHFLDDISDCGSSLPSVSFTNSDSDDTYASANPLAPFPVLSLTRISVSPVVDVRTNITARTNHAERTNSTETISSQLVDTGGNFNMTNNLDLLVHVVAIKPFDIGMAASICNSKNTAVSREGECWQRNATRSYTEYR